MVAYLLSIYDSKDPTKAQCTKPVQSSTAAGVYNHAELFILWVQPTKAQPLRFQKEAQLGICCLWGPHYYSNCRT